MSPSVPFFLRRPAMLVRDLVVDRDRPDFDGLARERDPERFVWRILPHAARTFSACIVMLPARLALPAAVAYLYCRCLDTYEDLAPGATERDAALARFTERLDAWERSGADLPEPAPALDATLAKDARDRGHVLLVDRCALVDRVFVRLRPEVRAIVRDLVRAMAGGMRWAARTFEAQGGVLADGEQLGRYCAHVLGEPIVFATRLMRLADHGEPDLSPELLRTAYEVGEFIQLANVTRDVEKDLARGIAYHPSLAGEPDAEAVRRARAELLDRALALAPAYARLIDGLELRRVSLARASCVLMLLYTERYYHGCARRVGRTAARRGPSGLGLLLRALPTIVSRRATTRLVARCEASLLALR